MVTKKLGYFDAQVVILVQNCQILGHLSQDLKKFHIKLEEHIDI